MAWKNKYDELKVNKFVKGWYVKMYKKSTVSANVWLRNLGLFLERTNLKPEDIIDRAQSGELKTTFRKYVESMEEKKYAGSYITKYKTVLNSFLKYNDINFKLEDSVDEANKYRSVFHEHVPTQEELADIIRHAKIRSRVSIALMAFSGLRPGVIGNDQGTDGLKLGDMEGLDLKTLEFKKIPVKITVREYLSKTRNEYFTFIGSEGAKYIIEYLKDRNSKGEKLTTDSFLISFNYGTNKRETLRTLLITREIRESMRKAGIDSRPYVLRRYFASQLSIGESKGYITHEWRQFLMGHSGDMESTYVNAKGNMSPDLVKVATESYSKCLKILETGNIGNSEDEMALFVKRSMLQIAGYSDKEIESMDLFNMTNDEISQRIKDKMNGSSNEVLKPNSQGQVIIRQDKVSDYFSKGYAFITSIGNGQVIMKIP